MQQLDDFTRAYIECALGSILDCDYNGETLDRNFTLADIHEVSLAVIEKDCRKFQEENVELLNCAKYCDPEYSDEAMAGHDFWCTRNGYGVGYWDGCLDEQVGELLTDAAERKSMVTLYVGDDGLLHCMNDW